VREGVLTLFKYPVCPIHQDETKRLCTKGPKIAREKEPIWDYRTRVSVHVRHKSTHSSLTLAHHASPTHLLERREMGERQGELGADFKNIFFGGYH
jgi:hypothetical protein